MTKARDLANAGTALTTVSATELGYLDGVTSAVQTQVDAKIPKTLTTTTGDIIYASSANTPARLGVGSTGDVLTVAAGAPVWAAAGGGKVLQVKMGTYSTQVDSSSTSAAATGLTVSITPSSSSSKVLVMIRQSVQKTAGNSENSLLVEAYRGATAIAAPQPTIYLHTATALAFCGEWVFMYLDSPATTSSTAYSTKFNNRSPTAQVSCQYLGATSTIIVMEIGA